MRARLIEVSYMVGDDRQGGSLGPRRLLEAGADRALAARGFDVAVDRVERDAPFRDSTSASLGVNRQLARSVREAVKAGEFPLVLAGSCDSSLGVVAGLDSSQPGIVWFDAHGDFNTPDSTVSGFFPGMSLAVLVGHCYRNLWAALGSGSPLSESATLLLGVRDLDPAERERLERSAVQVVGWREGRPEVDPRSALDRLSERVREIYLHIDLDALDPEAAPGIVDHPVPGGLSMRDLEGILRDVAARFEVKAATLATFNPERDKDGKTLEVGLEIVGLIAGCASSRQNVA